MNFTVRVPGSCGELIQGSIGGRAFLVTCPINKYSMAGTGSYFSYLPRKTHLARLKTMEYIKARPRAKLCLLTQLPPGKGMASSSADIAAVCQATALSCGRTLTEEEISAISVSIEPTDGVFCRGIVRYSHLTGEVLERFDTVPAVRLLLLDMGGKVDTLGFNRRRDLGRLYTQNESDIKRALCLLRRGFAENDITAIGQAAAISAYANQSILRKHCLEDIMMTAERYGAAGVNAAHSGTVVGVMFAKDSESGLIDSCRDEILSLCRGVRCLGTADLVPGGMQITKHSIEYMERIDPSDDDAEI